LGIISLMSSNITMLQSNVPLPFTTSIEAAMLLLDPKMIFDRLLDNPPKNPPNSPQR